MATDKISVIVPVYNAETYIGECIRSVLLQTYRNIELILVDDGSTDKSGIICDQAVADDDRVKVIHQANAGATKARKNGFSASDGEYIYFLDADDTIEHDTLEYMLSLFNENTDLVVSDYNHDIVLDWQEYAKILLTHGLWYACMKLYRRSLFDEYTFDTPRYFKSGEDFLMQLRTLKNFKGSIRCSTTRKYHYREVSDSASRAFTPTMEYEINLMNQAGEIIRPLPPSEILSHAYFKFRIAWLGGMMGLQYPIAFDEKWVTEILDDSRKYKLTLWEKISLKAVRHPLFRQILIAEKKLKGFYRKHLKKHLTNSYA